MNDDEQAMGELLAGTGLRPDDEGWKQAVLQAVEAPAPSQQPSHRWRWLGVLVPMAAAAVLVIALPGPDPGPGPDPVDGGPPLEGIEVERVGRAGGLRGDDLHPGDVVRVRGPVPKEGVVELRVYRDGRALVLRCPGGKGCARSPGVVEATFPLTGPGTYQVLLLAGPGGLPEPTGRLDEDAAAAAAAKVAITLGDPLEVR